MDAIEIVVDGTLYRCYRARTSKGDGAERYIVAGVGSVAIEAATGALISAAAVIEGGAALLMMLAPILHARSAPRSA